MMKRVVFNHNSDPKSQSDSTIFGDNVNNVDSPLIGDDAHNSDDI